MLGRLFTTPDEPPKQKTNPVEANSLESAEIVEHNDIPLDAIDSPPENRPISAFRIGPKLEQDTFHMVEEAIEPHNQEWRKFYIKHNAPDSFMSELEAVCAEYYKIIAPHLIPRTYALYDEKHHYVGVASEELVGFKSHAKDPLQKEDINIDFITERQIPFAALDKLDDEIRALEETEIILERQSKRLERYKTELDKKLEKCLEKTSIQTSPQTLIETKKIYENIKNYTNRKNILLDELIKNKEAEATFYLKHLQSAYKLTKNEIDRYRLVKGLAISMTASYIFNEDDLHQNNLCKNGKRIDFDMSLWSVLHIFKDRSIFDKVTSIRLPKGLPVISEIDIEKFPVLTNAKPFYWPTINMGMLSQASRTIAETIINIAKNSFSTDANSVFQKLEDNKVFVYHKFATFLKFTLIPIDSFIYSTLLHLRQNAKHGPNYLMNIISQFLYTQASEISNTLLKLDKFREFILLHGENILENILNQIKERNLYFNDKISKLTDCRKDIAAKQIYEKQLIAEELLIKNFTTLKEEVRVFKHKDFVKQFESLRFKVIDTMNTYLNPGLFKGNGFFRTHNKLAENLKEFALKLTPADSDQESYQKILNELKTKLQNEIAHLTTGEFYRQLSELLTAVKEISFHEKDESEPLNKPGSVVNSH